MAVNWGFNPFDIVGAIGSIVNTRQTNKTNLQIARETNQANREMVEMQNKAAREEAEKAYKRSSAPNQVAQMMSAGMSRAGAINALNGGGSYTPAPVNVSQDSAPQMQTTDLSALSNVMQIQSQKATEKHQEKLQEQQIKASKEQHKAQLESNERIAQLNADTTNRNADNRLDFDYQKHLETLGFEKEKWNYLAPLQKEQLKAVVNNLKLDGELKQEQKRDIIYKIDEYQSKENRNMRDAETLLRAISAEYNYNMTQKDFYDYRDKYYMPIYENGKIISYEPRRLDRGDASFSYAADRFWHMVGNIIPIEYLGKIVATILK